MVVFPVLDVSTKREAPDGVIELVGKGRAKSGIALVETYRDVDDEIILADERTIATCVMQVLESSQDARVPTAHAINGRGDDHLWGYFDCGLGHQTFLVLWFW
ncbi:MAG: hypothetical protein QG653_509 [Patescibacteria group bacterium]|nr:hypothetical protein [Patescibacteria group bacterium]